MKKTNPKEKIDFIENGEEKESNTEPKYCNVVINLVNQEGVFRLFSQTHLLMDENTNKLAMDWFRDLRRMYPDGYLSIDISPMTKIDFNGIDASKLGIKIK